MKWIKWILGFILLIVSGVFIFGFIIHEKEPVGISSREADHMAQEMHDALGGPYWDSLPMISWRFMGQNTYVWDKVNHDVRYESGGQVTVFNTKTLEGKSKNNGKILKEKELEKAIDQAWKSFCNDGFWAFAPFQITDPSITRSIVKVKDGRSGLKIKYNSGGVTPGDSYVWFLNPSNRPESFKIWVNILPIGGLEFEWSDWILLDDKIQIALERKIRNRVLSLEILAHGESWQEMGYSENPFNL